VVNPGTADYLHTNCEGRFGGTLVISQRSEPKILNPITALDGSSRDVIGLTMADLIHINRHSQQTEPALAKSWTVFPGGRRYLLRLRRGLRFSDGQPFDADDVIFSFRAYLDERFHSPQRDLLVIDGKPITVRKIDPYSVEVDLPEPDAAAERIFDSVFILPRRLLEAAYVRGTLAHAWDLSSSPRTMAGLGPYRFSEYVPGQRIVFERNPFYWKLDSAGHRLPYLDRIVVLFIPDPNAEAIRFEAGETDIISRVSAANFRALEKDQPGRGYHMYDAGPGLEFDFLCFNLDHVGPDSDRELRYNQAWFSQVAFRQAISSALDRDSIARLAFRGLAQTLSSHVSTGNIRWRADIPRPSRSVATARQLLRNAGFLWRKDGVLVDKAGTAVEFPVIVSASNSAQIQAASIIQQDLSEIGIQITIVPLEFRTMLDRVFTTFNYEAAMMALVNGDADPNPEMNIWTSTGSAHIWDLTHEGAQPDWQLELDRLMRQQMTTLDYSQRKKLYDAAQQIVWTKAPLISLVSPDVLVGAKDRIGNFHPSVLANYTLWNVEELFDRH
jgi:peptide/nickel transport system substrate-binding protein